MNNKFTYLEWVVGKLRLKYDQDYSKVTGEEFIDLLLLCPNWTTGRLNEVLNEEDIKWLEDIVASRTGGA